ncbi:hypothetical protein ACT3XG_14565 [Paenibacillus polymyxa]|nr:MULTISPECIES: hypothetical protein [Paenibacillus]WHX33898.1 hypothetical protein QNH38_15000 [Paenibacillus polymyxa]
MYAFLLNMWTMRKVGEARLTMYTPKFITEDERKAIVATPQKEAA